MVYYFKVKEYNQEIKIGYPAADFLQKQADQNSSGSQSYLNSKNMFLRILMVDHQRLVGSSDRALSAFFHLKSNIFHA